MYGLEALVVFEASLRSQIISGNTNAPTIMMTDKISDTIRGLATLPSAEMGFYEMPGWKICQTPGEPAVSV